MDDKKIVPPPVAGMDTESRMLPTVVTRLPINLHRHLGLATDRNENARWRRRRLSADDDTNRRSGCPHPPHRGGSGEQPTALTQGFNADFWRVFRALRGCADVRSSGPVPFREMFFTVTIWHQGEPTRCFGAGLPRRRLGWSWSLSQRPRPRHPRWFNIFSPVFWTGCGVLFSPVFWTGCSI